MSETSPFMTRRHQIQQDGAGGSGDYGRMISAKQRFEKAAGLPELNILDTKYEM